jgi:hypothetical protein
VNEQPAGGPGTTNDVTFCRYNVAEARRLQDTVEAICVRFTSGTQAERRKIMTTRVGAGKN